MCRILTLCFLTGFVLSARAGADEPLPEQLTITPLIESAGIELPGQSAGADNTLRFREAGTTQWQDANPLYFDPVIGSLSGAVVYLKPSSHYDIELSVTDDTGTRLYTDSFYTRADKPPVDPQKIYHLKDIYQGGTLDVEALGIEGAPGAWAMIKGDLNTPIVAPEDALSAIRIGAQSYVYFEDITIAQGGQLGFFAEEAHHIWVNGRGMMWAAIKAGGVSSNPEGQVNLFNNYVYSSGNGITASYVQGDDGFWVNAVNNVIITGPATDVSGFSILDKQFDAGSRLVATVKIEGTAEIAALGLDTNLKQGPGDCRVMSC